MKKYFLILVILNIIIVTLGIILVVMYFSQGKIVLGALWSGIVGLNIATLTINIMRLINESR